MSQEIPEMKVFERKEIERIVDEAAIRLGFNVKPRDYDVIFDFVTSLRDGRRTAREEIEYVAKRRFNGYILSP